MKDNHFISASAGTGKTYALTTRLIRLLLLGAEPASIAALTFTRAAAGEIFNKLAGRLAAAATTATAAEDLSGEIFAGLPAWQDTLIRRRHGAPLPPAVFAETLRKLVATQHQGFIGTLDSFMWRMVRIFPLELGFAAPDPRLMDAHESGQAAAAAIAQVLNATPRDTEEFFEDFRAATQGDENKTFFGGLAKFVQRWHRHRLDFPRAQSWGDPRAIWGAAGMPFAKNAAAITAFETVVAGAPEFADRRDALLAVGKFVREFNGTFDAPTPLKNMLENWTPDGALGPFNCDRKKTLLSPRQQAAAHALLSHLLATALEIRLRHTAGLFRLMTRYETAYAGTARDHGRLVFDDIPRKLAALGDAERDLLAFRLDSQIRHWLLDEFQDTSRAQWNDKVNRPLIREALQENEDHDQNWRSVFIVGDAKQSIYGWRGGDVTLFNEEKDRPEYTRGSLTASYRFGRNIVEAVNAVFHPAAIRAYLAADAAGTTPAAGHAPAADAAERWGKIWETHSAATKKNGAPGAPGQVILTTFQKDAASERDEFDVCADNIIAELDRTRPWETNLESGAAILVRTNDEGKNLAERLSARGIRVAWEGESTIGDCPVVAALLNLVRLSTHPSDTFARRHLAATPLLKDEAAAAVAETFALDTVRLGLAGALRKIIGETGAALAAAADTFTRARLDTLLLAAAQFEAGAGADTHPDEFTAFVEACRRRDFADPSVVKILTIHRSKGLGFDYVIVPFFESEGMDSVSNPKSPVIAADWILENPGKNAISADPVLGNADATMRRGKILENLCLCYVAMTRAKTHLSLHVKNATNKDGRVSDTKYFSTHLINQL
ncbi:MAG: UvrD-helicase domain-containing protein, partial [Opitutaceae bacterium]|nr:UvrD-helicase domain-containing protein [Opitutaceae bacterium]